MITRFLFIACLFTTVSANAQIVTNAKFRAMSLDEMLTPLLIAKQFQQECLKDLEATINDIEQAEQFINEEKDSITWHTYVTCRNSTVNEYNSILESGTNSNTRKTIRDLQKQGTSFARNVKIAYERRDMLARDQYNRLRAVDGLTCDRFFFDISLDEFMNGKIPKVNYTIGETMELSKE